MIRSTKHAFDTIDTQLKGIPYEAIDFLRNQESNKDISEKLVYALKNAYNGEAFYSDEYRMMMPAPLWYCVVAEKHLSTDLIAPLLDLFNVEEDWDLLNEQAVYLVGLLAREYPEKCVSAVLDFIEENIKEDNKKPYIYCFEALYYALENQFNRIHAILEKENFHWVDHYVRVLGDLMREDTLAKFKSMRSKFEGKHTAIELQYYIDVMEGKVNDFQKGSAFCEMRDPEWKNHYQHMEHIFASAEAPIEQGGKINRNDSCPCGSGKKYKQCCLKNKA
ncbi:SEC-C domain-containing protein [Labilibaculum sp. DW002]|uniref:SEC-C domain-containing protein n=1 Tax=Paralabilibaculum antarcticum TaxID=2912572 RepID=A0ABT5VM74_9BACT|nr:MULTISPECIES: SEC-C metal-binding domain-containing protein [unclassified Labilibaculum]MBI9059399.1 SEC-C domain-containing protein [Labilibaculum sp.]MDE5416540.1 SEC-C domain-containing protein [Labilibaculum sp. DW002]